MSDGVTTPVPELLGHLAIALAIGGLIGAERERHVGDGEEAALGLRTFALICVSGALLAHLSAVSGNPTFQ